MNDGPSHAIDSRSLDAARDRLRANPDLVPPGEDPDRRVNPYAHDKRIAMNHRVFETLTRDLAALSNQLVEEGYSARQASQAELLQMLMHDSMPRTVDEAKQRLDAWAMVKASPPARVNGGGHR